MLTMCPHTLVINPQLRNANTPLPASLRKEVQEKFAAGITIERIMDGKAVP